MKKTIVILLALVMVLSLAACGGGGTTTETPAPTEAPTTPTPTPEPTEEPKATEYAIGEAFGTDSIECVITEVRWMTLEDAISHPKAKTVINANGVGSYKSLAASDAFPGYQFFGISGFSSKASGYPLFCVTFTLQNIGKAEIEGTIKGYTIEPYGNIAVVYGDGYTFDADKGFTTTLKVLGDVDKEGRIFNLPSQVSENTEEPLLIKISLPTSTNELEEFFVSAR